MNDFDNDMISRYFDGEMNAEEQNAFEDQMQKDEQLRNQVELTREVNETLRMKLYPDENELALRKTFAAIRPAYFSTGDQQHQSKAKVIHFRRTMWIAVAAAVIVIVFLTVWSPWQKDLYHQYASIEMPGVAERGVAADSLLKQANTKFNEKKFAESLPMFEAILKDDPKNSFVHFYYAIALLENDQIDKSRNELMQLYNGASILRYDAAFYMALSYLKEKNKTVCKEWLQKIPADAGIYSKAEELQKKL